MLWLAPLGLDTIIYYGPLFVPFPTPFLGQSATHRAWVGALERGDTLSAGIVFGLSPEGGQGAAAEIVAELRAVRRAGAMDGRPLGRFRRARAFPAGGTWTSRSAPGLSLWEFERGSLCYSTGLARQGSLWRVTGWALMPDALCAAQRTTRAPSSTSSPPSSRGSQAPPARSRTPTARV